MLSIWNLNILRPLGYIYKIKSDFEFEKKIQILLDAKWRNFFFDHPVFCAGIGALQLSIVLVTHSFYMFFMKLVGIVLILYYQHLKIIPEARSRFFKT